MNNQNRIICDKSILDGQPCIYGTRIPVYMILEAGSVENALAFYPHLTAKQAWAAFYFARDFIKRDYIILQENAERLNKIEREYNRLEGKLCHTNRKRLENRVIAHDALKKNIALRKENEQLKQFHEKVKKLIENKKEQQKDHSAESMPFKLLQLQILELESLFD